MKRALAACSSIIGAVSNQPPGKDLGPDEVAEEERGGIHLVEHLLRIGGLVVGQRQAYDVDVVFFDGALMAARHPQSTSSSVSLSSRCNFPGKRNDPDASQRWTP